ncbi:Stk1 family PASTA domain-containing Ser/Thr kinase [Microbacterium sp. C7(2022)]|uniref:Stk1 family PASTA domain-containing Ser/Thr kinase n=1 Tax=Microbacterium sp. C7(2022) TaxID=2992759 RepID=UPI00237A857E|nr:Stk1 family PASTA domain-containing Ser/Thr kinase [Microbacterium sp. C7(2022)]MDE0546739.1 Stk1 family PASTA domain-containing Ser/Thr kinase [Microbacterium sp. C7(2022)]
MNTSQQTDPLIGRLVDGRYRVRARIARGGMATVYVATDLRLERRVALKVMHSHLSDDTVFQSRFIQEARAAARLADPHVVNVFDQGQDGEMAYLVMEYLPGITLRELLREQKRLTLTQAVSIMDAILSGLSAAHRAGIVHRDVKPENVLLAEDGRIKIGDFGLARATTANTATGAQLLGTIAYLAPELVTRGSADARSDIYALGIMLFEMLTGEQPYKGEQPMQIAFQHATDSVPRPSVKNPGVPEQLDELVLWATERNPDDRPADAAEMLDRLREIERELGISPVVARAAAVTYATSDDGIASGDLTAVLPEDHTLPTATVDTSDNASRLRNAARRRRRKGAWLVILVLLLAGLAAGAGWFFGTGPGSMVQVADVHDLSFADAKARLAQDTLTAVQKDENSLDVEAGVVIRTDPAPGTRVDQDSSVDVYVSLGPAEASFDAFIGTPKDEATIVLASEEIAVTDQSDFYTDAAPDTVVGVLIHPSDGSDDIKCGEGCSAHQGDTATLWVSLGTLPSVVGMPADQAVGTLADYDISVTNQAEEYSDSVADGAVISMSDREDGGWWRPGDETSLTVSQGPRPVEVPDVNGWTIRDAVNELESQGFSVDPTIDDSELLLGFKAWDVYRVRGMNPAAGEFVNPSTTITLTAGP